MNSAVCPWCNREYLLNDRGEWPRHNRPLRLDDPARSPIQRERRCEGSGARHLSDEEAAKIRNCRVEDL